MRYVPICILGKNAAGEGGKEARALGRAEGRGEGREEDASALNNAAQAKSFALLQTCITCEWLLSIINIHHM